MVVSIVPLLSCAEQISFSPSLYTPSPLQDSLGSSSFGQSDGKRLIELGYIFVLVLSYHSKGRDRTDDGKGDKKRRRVDEERAGEERLERATARVEMKNVCGKGRRQKVSESLLGVRQLNSNGLRACRIAL